MTKTPIMTPAGTDIALPDLLLALRPQLQHPSPGQRGVNANALIKPTISACAAVFGSPS